MSEKVWEEILAQLAIDNFPDSYHKILINNFPDWHHKILFGRTTATLPTIECVPSQEAPLVEATSSIPTRFLTTKHRSPRPKVYVATRKKISHSRF